MDIGRGNDADLLQRALDGERVTDTGILELVAVLHAVTALDHAGLAPRREFVTDLRARLLADDPGVTALPVAPTGPEGSGSAPTTAPTAPGTPPTPAAAVPAAEPDGDRPGRRGGSVSVLRVAARPLKLAAAAAAAVLVLGGGLGAASRTAAPGDALYPIKAALDRAAIGLAGSMLDVGLTHLAQAQQHISEARELLDRGAVDAGDLSVALDAAAASTTRAQETLLAVHRAENRPDALTELADFMTRARPQVDALRSRVPQAALASWQRLRDLLGQGEVTALREVARCTSCGDRADAARAALLLLVSSAVSSVSQAAGAGTLPGSTPSAPPLPATGGLPGAGGVPLPSLPSAPMPTGASTLPTVPGVPVGGGLALPGLTVTLPSVRVTSGGGGVGGGGVTVPGVTPSLPGASATSGTIVVGGGGATVPGLPSVSVPSVSLTPPLGGGLLP